MGSYQRYYEVLRPISAEDGSSIPAGTVVDASGWRNLHRLIAANRIKPSDASAPTAAPAPAKKSKKAAAAVDAIEETTEAQDAATA